MCDHQKRPDAVNLFDRHHCGHHLYDTQLIAEVSVTIDRLQQCIVEYTDEAPSAKPHEDRNDLFETATSLKKIKNIDLM